jgi:hypothetical protein
MNTIATTRPIATTTKKVRKPDSAESMPPRSFRIRGGGGGASVGFKASLGLCGPYRVDGAAALSMGTGLALRLKNIALLDHARAALPRRPQGFATLRSIVAKRC